MKTRFRLRKLSLAMLGVLALPSVTMGASITLQSDYLYLGANDYGTLGYYRNSSPGIQHDPTGTGTFSSTKDYIAPGAPFEGFTIYDSSGVVVNNNNNDLGGSASATTNATAGSLKGAVLDKSGVAHVGTTADYRAYWSDNGSNAKVSVVNDVTFSATDQAVKITTTITAKQDLTGLKFLRAIDPDQDSPVGSTQTYNTQGAEGVAASNIVCGKGWIRELRICLYSKDSVTHNTGVSSAWTRNPDHYLAGTNNGNGDYTLGLAFDIGALANGESISFVYYYLFAEDLSVLADLINNAGGVSQLNTQFVTHATARGLGPLAQLIADNASTFATLVGDLNTLDADALAQALKKILPTEQSAPARSTMASTAGVTSLVFDKAGTFLGDMAPARSFMYQPARSGQDRIAPVTTEQTFRERAQQLAAHPLDLRLSNGRGAASSLTSTAYDRYVPGSMGAWVQGFVDYGRGDASDSKLGFDNATYGVVSAVERGLSADSLLGVMVAYQEGSTELNDSAGSTDSETALGGVYLQQLAGKMKITGSFGVGGTKYETVRHIDAGATSATAESSYRGRLYTTTVGASRLYTGDSGWQLEPFANVSYTYNKTSAYEETGAGVLNMAVGKSVNEYVALRIGTVVRWDVDLGRYSGFVKLKPSVSFQDEIRAAQPTVGFVSGTGNVLLNGREIDPVVGGIGLEGLVNLNKDSRLRTGVDYSQGSEYRATQLFVHYDYLF